jgi:RNA polymerase sigma factor (sigma-70 family)
MAARLSMSPTTHLDPLPVTALRADRPRGNVMEDVLAELRPHERKLLGYIARRQGDPSRAEDILQQTLLTVMEQSRKQTIEQPVAYAYRVADSLIYAQARKDRREEELGDEDYGCDLPLADEVLEHKQRVVIFETALRRLSPIRRDIFIRRHMQGHSRQQIADDLEIGLEAVKKHLVRAMAELTLVMDDATELASTRGTIRER